MLTNPSFPKAFLENPKLDIYFCPFSKNFFTFGILGFEKTNR